VFLRDAQILVGQLKGSAGKVDPILTNLNSASADAARATKDVSRLTATLNNPRTLADLRATLANARQLTARWEAVGGDVQKLSGDPRFLDGIRSVSVGLGKFFDELYPAATDSARQRQTRPNGARGGGNRSDGSDAAGTRAIDRLLPLPPPRRNRSLSAADRNEQQRGPQLPPSSRR
jgi:phospholipid/cholesterol/gamma-HCH transport system substrate-binding protein